LGDDEETDKTEALSLMNDPESLSEESSMEGLVKWIKDLQNEINKLQDKIKGLKASHKDMKTQLLSRTQKQMERDPRTFKKVYALVMEKIFPYKKFVKSQNDLDDMTEPSSLGRLIMDKMEIDQPDQFPFWNAYKEIVADAIANWWTIVANDLKKSS
jgi:predicted RNase H-like nuclease (RuvC/YqgF family)